MTTEPRPAGHVDTTRRPPRLARAEVTVRIKISALWAATLFLFAFVDLFSLYRPDIRRDLDEGAIGGFTIGQPFLLLTTIYIAIPSVTLYATLVLPARVARLANLTLACLYALTIVASMIGQWHYFLAASAIELGLMIAIAHHSWTWPRLDSTGATQPLRAMGSNEGDQPWNS